MPGCVTCDLSDMGVWRRVARAVEAGAGAGACVHLRCLHQSGDQGLCVFVGCLQCCDGLWATTMLLIMSHKLGFSSV